MKDLDYSHWLVHILILIQHSWSSLVSQLWAMNDFMAFARLVTILNLMKMATITVTKTGL